FARKADGTGGEVAAGDGEASARPGPHVVAEAATGHADGAAWQFGMRGEKIHEAGRGFAFFPGHVAGLIAVFPVGFGHGERIVCFLAKISAKVRKPALTPALSPRRGGASDV